MTKQIINVGTIAGDGTGDKLRAGMQKVNANFTELYSRQGPVSGSLYPDVINAVKYFEINEMPKGTLFCITEIQCAVANGSDYDYLIEISKVSTIGGSPEPICLYEETVSSLKTGLTLVSIPEYDGSGFAAKMVINWSLLTAGSQYQMPNYADGALFAINVNSARFNDSEGSIQTIASADDTQILDGSKRLYLIPNVADDQIVTLCPLDEAVGDVVITIGASGSAINSFYIYATDPEAIEGAAAGVITFMDAPAQTITLVPLKKAGKWVLGTIAGTGFTISSNT